MVKKIFILFGLFLLLFLAANSFKPRSISVSSLKPHSGSETFPEKEHKYIAITFDDGPHPTYTPILLEGLSKRGVKASFFLVGENITGNEEIVERMAADGHLIGNHTSTHIMLTVRSKEEACREIEETNQKIQEITGNIPTCIRPPFGSWNEDLECIIPMEVILWNIDPLDWKVQNKNEIVNHVVSHAKNGSIILLHDSYKTSVEAALEIIDTLEREGYTFVTADELLID